MTLVAGFAGLGGCDGVPAHGKPWKHPIEKDPATLGPTVPSGAAAVLASEAAEAARRRGHTLRIRLESEPSHLNPLIDPDVDTIRIAEDTVFESLIRYEAPAGASTGAYQPGLAQSWRVVGCCEILITLRDDVKFHDGHRFSALDAQFSLDAARAGNVKAPRFRAALATVVSVEKLTPRDLRLTLRRPDAFVLRALAEVPMLPYHIYGEGELHRHAATTKGGRAPIGTGPWKFAAWERGQRIRLTRNDAYWGPKAAIEDLEFLVEPDGARAISRARQGELDVLPSLIPQHYPDQAQAMAADFALLRLRPVRFQYVVMNTRHPPFDDVRVRHALALLVDRGKLVAEIHHGFARAVAGPVWPGGPGDAAAPTPPAYDPDAAARLLDEAGWRDADGDGVREQGVGPAAEKLRAVLLATSDARGDAERDLVSSALRKAGFVVEVRAGEPAVLMNRLRDGDFGLAIMDWRGRIDQELAPLLATAGAANWGGYATRSMDAALSAIAAAWDPAARAAKVALLAQLLAQEWPIAPLTAPDPVGLVHRRVTGVVVRDGWIVLRRLGLEANK